MKKLILSTIIISLLSITSILADNNTTSKTNNQQTAISNQQSASTVVVTITDMNAKTVYTETFTVDTENGANIKLNPSSKLAKGMYIVTVVTGNEKMTDKLIVK